MPEAKRMRDKRLIDMRTDIGGRNTGRHNHDVETPTIHGLLGILSEGGKGGGQIRQCR